MLELAILGLLKEQDLHGYELKKRLTDTLATRSAVSFGSLYPALGRLEKLGAVRAVSVEDSGPTVLPTGSLGGDLAVFRARHAGTRGARGKKVYAITPGGEELFTDLLAAHSSPAEDQRLFDLRLAFARHLPPAARLVLLERRRAHLVDRLSRLSVRVRTNRDRLDTYARSLLDHDRESTEFDLGWIDRLIATERGLPSVSPGPGPVPLPGSSLEPPNPLEPPHPSVAPTPPGQLIDRPSLSGLRPPINQENNTV